MKNYTPRNPTAPVTFLTGFSLTLDASHRVDATESLSDYLSALQSVFAGHGQIECDRESMYWLLSPATAMAGALVSGGAK